MKRLLKKNKKKTLMSQCRDMLVFEVMRSVTDAVSDMVDPGGGSLGSEHEPGYY